MSVLPPRSSEFLSGSSLGFVKPMPQRGQGPQAVQEDSAEFDVGPGPASPASALELWHKLLPDPAHADRTSCAGLMLGHFRVEEQIGRGGMGAVFRAVDTRLDREVALKVLAGPQSTDRSSVERFLNEARAAARLDHDNIARVFFVGQENGLHYIAFEFVHGSNVRQVIESRGTLRPSEAVNYTLQIAHALRHVGAAGVVHRDIKPSNIIITPAGRAKLVDLGLARKVDPDASKDLTVDGTTLGTFDYISPEQAKNPRGVDIRSDIYSLGCTLYHMLTGEPPYPQGTMLQKLLDHQHKDVPDASSRNSSVPPELSAVVKKMMASDPNDRYQTADELIGDLTILAHAYGLRPVASEAHVWAVPQRPGGWQLLHRYRAWLATAALLIAGVLGIDFVQSLSDRTTPPGAGARIASNESQQPGTGADPTEPALPGPESDPESPVSPSQWDADAPPGLDVSSDNGSTVPVPDNEILLTDTPVESPGADSQAMLPTPSDERIASGNAPFDLRDLEPLSPDGITLSDDLDAPETGTSSGSANGRTADESVSDETGTDEGVGSALAGDPFVVVASGEDPQGFATLEAACEAAPDGSVIELNFDGPSAELQRPIRIEGKQLRLLNRSPSGRPIVRFGVPPDEEGSAEIVRMMTVIRGSLDVYNVGFEFEAKGNGRFFADSWVLLSLKQADGVLLQGVSVTVHNPRRHPAAIFEMAESASGFADRMPEMDRPALRVVGEDSVFRGQADLLLCENVDPARIRLSNVAVALSGSLLHLRGMDEYDVMADMNLDHSIELGLRHVTALLGREALRFAIDGGRQVSRVSVSADNSVLVNIGNPLIRMTGEIDEYEARGLLEWSGGHTFIDAQDPIWRIVGSFETDFDLAACNDMWRHGRLEPAGDANLLPRDRSIPYDEMTRADLKLVIDPDIDNPAVEGASDSTDAGVQWDSLPDFAPS